MRFNLKIRTLSLGKKSIDVVKELYNWGINTTPGEYSTAINGALRTPKAELILETADKIVTKWEREIEINRTARSIKK